MNSLFNNLKAELYKHRLNKAWFFILLIIFFFGWNVNVPFIK